MLSDGERLGISKTPPAPTKVGNILEAKDWTGIYKIEAWILSSDKRDKRALKEFAANRMAEAINAIFKPPNSPPKILFNIPKDAKLANFVKAFPAIEMPSNIAIKVRAKAVRPMVFSGQSK